MLPEDAVITKFGGHGIYTKRCVTPDQIGSIHVTDRRKNYSLFSEVVLKGPRVGKPVHKTHKIHFERPWCLPDDIRIGDLLFSPKEHRGICRPWLQDPAFGWTDYEMFIEEHTPFALFRDGQYIPIGNKVYALMMPEREVGGIQMADKVLQTQRKAQVLATGTGTMTKDGKTRIPPRVKEGDVILVPEFGGKRVTLLGNPEGEDRRFFAHRPDRPPGAGEDEILAILEE